MRNILFFAFCFGIALHLGAQTSTQPETPIQSLVSAELAFAKLASEKNAHDAFLANIESLRLDVKLDRLLVLLVGLDPVDLEAVVICDKYFTDHDG